MMLYNGCIIIFLIREKKKDASCDTDLKICIYTFVLLLDGIYLDDPTLCNNVNTLVNFFFPYFVLFPNDWIK